MKKRMKMEGSRVPVQRVSLNRRKLKQEDLPRGGKEWLVQSVSLFLHVFPAYAGVERQFLFVAKECFFSSILP